MNEVKWIPDLKDLTQIPEDGYKFIYENAKEKFEDTISNSEDITTKSIKLISAMVVAAPFIIGLGVQHICYGFIFIFTLVYLIDFILLLRLLSPKEIITRGSEPKFIFNAPYSRRVKLYRVALILSAFIFAVGVGINVFNHL